jgi:hypothetical protein
MQEAPASKRGPGKAPDRKSSIIITHNNSHNRTADQELADRQAHRLAARFGFAFETAIVIASHAWGPR